MPNTTSDGNLVWKAMVPVSYRSSTTKEVCKNCTHFIVMTSFATAVVRNYFSLLYPLTAFHKVYTAIGGGTEGGVGDKLMIVHASEIVGMAKLH